MAATDLSPNVDNYYVGKGIVSFKKDGETTFRDVGNVPEFEFSPTLETLDHFSSRTGVKTKDKSIITSKTATIRMVMDELTAQNLSLFFLGETDAAVNLVTTGDTTNTDETVENLASVVGLVAGRTYNIAGAGIPVGATFVYVSGNDIELSAPATATATAVSLTITAGIALDIFSASEIDGWVRFVGTNDYGANITIDLPNVVFKPSGSFNPISDEWGQVEVTGEVTAPSGSFGTMYWTP